jgi:hypothetical protein
VRTMPFLPSAARWRRPRTGGSPLRARGSCILRPNLVIASRWLLSPTPRELA